MFIRFMIWPIVAFGFISLDQKLSGGYLQPIYPVIQLLSLMPVAANLAVYATEMDLYPQRAATVVLLSTILAAIIIPIVYAFIL